MIEIINWNANINSVYFLVPVPWSLLTAGFLHLFHAPLCLSAHERDIAAPGYIMVLSGQVPSTPHQRPQSLFLTAVRENQPAWEGNSPAVIFNGDRGEVFYRFVIPYLKYVGPKVLRILQLFIF